MSAKSNPHACRFMEIHIPISRKSNSSNFPYSVFHSFISVYGEMFPFLLAMSWSCQRLGLISWSPRTGLPSDPRLGKQIAHSAPDENPWVPWKITTPWCPMKHLKHIYVTIYNMYWYYSLVNQPRPCQIGDGRLVSTKNWWFLRGRTVNLPILPEGNLFYMIIHNLNQVFILFLVTARRPENHQVAQVANRKNIGRWWLWISTRDHKGMITLR